jgi:hypothetical protein
MPNRTIETSEATYRQPKHGWTCYHCGETFTTPGSARDHFGATPEAKAGCLIKAGDERGLLMALRQTEDQVTEWRNRALRAENQLESTNDLDVEREYTVCTDCHGDGRINLMIDGVLRHHQTRDCATCRGLGIVRAENKAESSTGCVITVTEVDSEGTVTGNSLDAREFTEI